MAAKNDITGDRLVSKSATNAYRDNYDAIFGSKKKKVELTAPCPSLDIPWTEEKIAEFNAVLDQYETDPEQPEQVERAPLPYDERGWQPD